MFQVTYTDDVAVDKSTLLGDGVLVTGPGGFAEMGIVQGVVDQGANATAGTYVY